MNSPTIQSEARALATNLVSGQLDAIASRFAFPVIVHVGEKIIVMIDQEQLEDALGMYRAILVDEWLSLIDSTVSDVTRDSSGSCKVSLKNRYFAVDGREIGTARINFYGESNGEDCKVRMVEYLDWPCADRIAQCLPLQRMMA